MVKEKTTADAQQEQTAAPDNLRFYNAGKTVPKDALKEIRAGRLKGMSDINPMWRMKRMTEIFGPVGFGWKYTIDKQWEEAHGAEVKVFTNISLYIRDPETKEWSEPIIGCGGSAIVSMEKSGAYVNDEAYKMALTDALSIAMKPIGIGADIWYGGKATGHNESKYEQYTRYEQQPAAPAFTGAQMVEALADVAASTSQEQVQAVWQKWAAKAPALCASGTDFYKAVANKNRELNAA